MSCDSGVDPVFYRAFMKHQRLMERDQEYRARREEQFRELDIDEIEEYLRSTGEIPSSTSPEFVATPAKQPPSVDNTPLSLEEEVEVVERRKKRKLFVDVEDAEDPLPMELRHLRHTERKVKDSYYTTCATLSGEGFSLHECTTAVITVGNGMFGRKCKKDDDKDSFDVDTAPEKIHLLEKLRQIEAQSLSLVVEEMKKGQEAGRMITHASDSTTKRGVGQFNVQVSFLITTILKPQL